MDETTYRNPAAEHAAETPSAVSVLPSDLSNRIAAGEVVERPASVVKELVENSLDAGAETIEIRIEAGGRESVEVVDDGCGMAREDLLRAIERHATSKLDDPSDLERIGTLGFRGEALPSIGAVSRMAIRSKPHGAVSGTRVLVEGGELQEVADAGLPAGTIVRVDELFYNTPARRKFMKSKRAESRRITEMLTRMSLSRPDVRFVLERDGTVRLDLSKTDEMLERIREVMGRDVYEAMYPTWEYPAIDGVVARGYFSEPGHDQRSSKNIYTYVNGRYVEDATIRAAVQKAYGELLDSGRYPSVVLFVEVPFDVVDVNVHPMKTEVRFDDTQPVFRAVYHAIGDALAETPWVEEEGARRYELDEGDANDEDTETDGRDAIDPASNEVEPLSARNRRRSEQRDGAPSGGANGGELDSPFYERRSAGGDADDGQQGFDARGAEPLGEPPTIEGGTPGEEPPDDVDGRDGRYFSTLRVLGQVKRAYIVCEDATGLVVIDQHAAHERIGFEQLRRVYEREHDETQSMLFGQRLEFDAVRADCMAEYGDFFERAGFELEHFGGQTWALKSAPAVLGDADQERVIRDALDELAEIGETERIDEAMETVLSRMACHSVVRGPTELTQEECESLLEQMDQIDFRANCPHGRPVYYRMPIDELEKAFERT